MTKYQETYQQARDTATAIAAHLDGWEMRSEQDDRWPNLYHAETGASLFLRIEDYGSQSGKMNVSTNWPKDNGKYMSARSWGVIPYGTNEPSCAFSPSRNPFTVAKEITRKVITEYLPLYLAALKRQGEDQERRDTAGANIQTLANIVGIQLTDRGLRPDDKGFTGYVQGKNGQRSDTVYADVETHGDKASIKLTYLPMDVAERVLHALTQ